MVRFGWGASLMGLAAAVMLTVSADARPWKPSPSAVAQDYLQIQQMKPGGELVVLMWIAPPMIDVPAAKELLEKYVVIAIVHGRTGPAGTLLFDDIPDLQALDGAGKPLHLYTEADMPADMAQGVQALQGVVRQALGAMGKGMTFFVFDGSKVKACTKGKLTIPYDGEDYTYETPIPGCPAE